MLYIVALQSPVNLRISGRRIRRMSEDEEAVVEVVIYDLAARIRKSDPDDLRE